MGTHLIQTEDKLFLLMKHAPSGMAEINSAGNIIYINPRGEIILKAFLAANTTSNNNITNILAKKCSAEAEELRSYIRETAISVNNNPRKFFFPIETDNIVITITITLNRLSADSIIVYLDDTTEKNIDSKAIQKAAVDKAVVQGKFDIASNVLHDVGNAVVGFSSYLTRIKRSLELDNAENLKNLVGFFETQRAAVSMAVGEAKADAIIKIISGIAQTQKNNQADISKSISEQQNIINHIQEILNIQRQYVNGAETIEKNRPT